MKKYLSMIYRGMIEGFTFRASYIAALAANLGYMIFTYYIWKSIFEHSDTKIINNMSVSDTIVYTILALAIFNVIEMSVVWEMDDRFKKGDIILDLIKPMDYPVYLFFDMYGRRIDLFITCFLPIFICVYFMTNGSIPLGINLIIFVIALFFATVIHYCIDFLVGSLVFFTHSTHGINTIKVIIVSFLSGGAIPLAFFPETLQSVMRWLPFHTIYDVPLRIIISDEMMLSQYISILGVQVLWIVILCFSVHFSWNKVKSRFSGNGG